MTKKDLENICLSDIFKCKLRDGPQGTICRNCGRDHMVTEEYLRVILDARMKYLTEKMKEKPELESALKEIERLLK